ncbi:MAG TPA: hypothetical protein VNH11_17645 [Pirellulales bacterium]|nr:hypothetical protein [Pirellulales bacterium]
MSTNDANRGAPPENQQSYAGLIVVSAIVGLGVVWTYIFFGPSGLGWWAKGAATLVILSIMIGAWRWRQKRTQQQLAVLQRWAEAGETSAARRPPRPANR